MLSTYYFQAPLVLTQGPTAPQQLATGQPALMHQQVIIVYCEARLRYKSRKCPALAGRIVFLIAVISVMSDFNLTKAQVLLAL